jgi:hypothetical protein
VFDGIKKRYPLRLLSTKQFKSGNVVLIYEVTRGGLQIKPGE